MENPDCTCRLQQPVGGLLLGSLKAFTYWHWMGGGCSLKP